MTLYLQTPQGLTEWTGQPIDDIQHPAWRHYESTWSPEELEALGLFAPAPADPIPEGKISTGQTVQRINGVVKYVHTLAEAPPLIQQPAMAHLYAAAAICITGGSISVIEQAAQLQSATYDDGWVMIGFTEPQDTADYLIFAQTDVPTKIEQFKEPGYFELVFSDPITGASIEPGRMDIQILKVR